ncbi:Tn3 family transposase [Streptomyces sannanensis]|uniref:Tn3 family transposase n=1 Tax=Streptomyces sannanensis TaxID=285536 RepID=UPI003CD0B60D
MIEGVLRHCADLEIDRQYTDTHGASIVGFAFAHMLGFNLLPRLSNVGSARLYRPAAGVDQSWPHLTPVLSTRRSTGNSSGFRPGRGRGDWPFARHHARGVTFRYLTPCQAADAGNGSRSGLSTWPGFGAAWSTR